MRGWRPGFSHLAEHAGLDPIDAAQAPCADDGAFEKLPLHPALRLQQHAHQLRVKSPEVLFGLIKHGDVLRGEAVP